MLEQIEREKGEQIGQVKSNGNNKLVTITEKEYRKLLDDSRQLKWLEQNGVDNWQGYSRYPSDE